MARKPSEVKVTRPDPVTGEVVEEVVPADHFAPKPPILPEPGGLRPQGLIRGWEVLYVHDYRELVAEYWTYHAARLTREERADLAAGRSTSVLRPLAPAWSKGDRIEVADKIEATVTEIEETPVGQHRTVFRVLDCRPWLLKQTVGGGSRPRTDERGFAIGLTPAVEEAARIDGAYTRSAALALRNAGETMDDKLRQRLHAEASMANAMKGAKRRVRVSKLQLEQRLEDARAKHQRSTAKVLERKLKAASGHMERAA